MCFVTFDALNRYRVQVVMSNSQNFFVPFLENRVSFQEMDTHLLQIVDRILQKKLICPKAHKI